jgi:hypothetical protein
MFAFDFVHVADEFDVDAAPTLGFERQILVSDILLVLHKNL